MNQYAIFDFADTLVERSPKQIDIVSECITKSTSISIPADAIRNAYKLLDIVAPYSSVTIKTRLDRDLFYIEYNKKLLTLLGVSHLVSPEILLSSFAECPAHWRLKSEARDLLADLKGLGWNIGIISNFDDNLHEIVYERLGLKGIIDSLFVSQVESVEKPDPLFYRAFISKYRVDLGRSFYVGDNYSLDFLPALEVGLKVLLLDESGSYPYLPQAIRSLSDIIALSEAGALDSFRW